MDLKRCQKVELPNVELADIKLGDVITVTLTGAVKSIEMGSDPAKEDPRYGGSLRYPTAHVEIEVSAETVGKTEKNVFSDLVKMEDEADDEAEARIKKEQKISVSKGPSAPTPAYED